jgi:hypothetical protein
MGDPRGCKLKVGPRPALLDRLIRNLRGSGWTKDPWCSLELPEACCWLLGVTSLAGLPKPVVQILAGGPRTDMEEAVILWARHQSFGSRAFLCHPPSDGVLPAEVCSCEHAEGAARAQPVHIRRSRAAGQQHRGSTGPQHSSTTAAPSCPGELGGGLGPPNSA